MEKETIEQITALKLELVALEAREARILTVIYSTVALAGVPVTVWLAGLL